MHFLDSDLWFDRPDAGRKIAARLDAGELGSAEAESLRQFVELGYTTFKLDEDEALFDRLLEGVDRLWREKPADLAYAYDGPARPLSEADEARERRTRYRIHDLHSHLPEARRLYLHPQIFDFVGRLAEREVVSIQSLFFEYGSQQMLHRDTVVVPTGAPSHLFGCWIALEDIHPESGALVYVPGSHRLPYFEFSPGEHRFDASRMGEEEIREGTAFEDEQARRHGLEPQLFTAEKGEVLVWHASLRHGGGPVGDPELTRKSLVVHFSLLDTYPERSITVVDRVENPEGDIEERPRVMETRELLEDGGCRGFDNPMRGERVS